MPVDEGETGNTSLDDPSKSKRVNKAHDQETVESSLRGGWKPALYPRIWLQNVVIGGLTSNHLPTVRRGSGNVRYGRLVADQQVISTQGSPWYVRVKLQLNIEMAQSVIL